MQVPAGRGDDLVRRADDLGAATLTSLTGRSGEGADVDFLVATVPNARVEPLIRYARELGAVEATVPATGAFAFEPPAGKPSEELLDVTPCSPYEIVLAGRQSAGSWTTFLAYAARP